MGLKLNNMSKIVTGRDAAKLLGISYPYFRQLVQLGKIPVYLKIGKRNRFREEDIIEKLRTND